jgi:predicted nucleotidyltransferase
VLAERPLPPDVDERLSTLASEWAADVDVAAAYLFGSRARGTAGPRSDVDLAVALRVGLDAAARWKKRLDLIASASRTLSTDAVDVVVLEDAPSALGHRVLRDGRLLCERDPVRRTAVAESVMRRYLDEEFLRKELDRALAERVREGRFAD